MRILDKMLKVLGMVVLVLFASLFIYANWSRPSLGEKIYMENPTQIVVMKFPESFGSADSTSMDQFFLHQKGVYSTNISLKSQTLCVTIDPRTTDRQTILSEAAHWNPELVERQAQMNRPECPVDLSTFQKITYALNLRK